MPSPVEAAPAAVSLSPRPGVSINLGEAPPALPKPHETVSFICCLILVLCGLESGGWLAGRGMGGAWQLALQFSLVETKEKTHNEIRNCNSGKGQRAMQR